MYKTESKLKFNSYQKPSLSGRRPSWIEQRVKIQTRKFSIKVSFINNFYCLSITLSLSLSLSFIPLYILHTNFIIIIFYYSKYRKN